MIDSFTKEILSKFAPNFWIFITQLLVFFILILGSTFLFYKPIKNFLKKRNDYIKKNIDDSQKNNLLSEKKISEANIILSNAYKKANMIIIDAQEKANNEYKKIIEIAKQKAKNEIEKTYQNIESEINNGKKILHNQIVEIVLLTCNKILKREITDNDNKKYIDYCISDLLSKYN